MFSISLLKKLIAIGDIKENSLLTTIITTVDYLNQPLKKQDTLCMQGFVNKDDHLLFKCVHPETNKIYFIKHTDIIDINGLDAKRSANLYGLDLNGNKLEVKIDPITGSPVRRGRKTKKEKELLENAKKQQAA